MRDELWRIEKRRRRRTGRRDVKLRDKKRREETVRKGLEWNEGKEEGEVSGDYERSIERSLLSSSAPHDTI